MSKLNYKILEPKQSFKWGYSRQKVQKNCGRKGWYGEEFCVSHHWRWNKDVDILHDPEAVKHIKDYDSQCKLVSHCSLHGFEQYIN